ncbi:SNF2 family N-terminal domain-containing protein [Dendryphion nanum]|uniref:SNF2 family N-terminal domain-containing protein n=1 Tax=Dendryphion nanum TaxID=256645 RepID=A0A9P9D097_9PLEO|nr:SNF2 family N-terminal domain-containing protein [Dendryphion nanum]
MISTRKHALSSVGRSNRPTKRRTKHLDNPTYPAQQPTPACTSSEPSPHTPAINKPSSLLNAHEGVSTQVPIACSVGDVCYGMVHCARVQFLDDPSIATTRLDVDQFYGKYYEVFLVMKRIHVLQTKDGTEVGILNTQTSKALSKMDTQSLVKYTVYVAVDEWKTKSRLSITKGKSTCLDIDINFYGSPSNGARVGRILSDIGQFLQPPSLLNDSVPYENPHEITFELDQDQDMLDRVSSAEIQSSTDFSVELFNTVLGDLSHSATLINRDVDMYIITTELKPHQKKALDFITHREALYPIESLSLYKKLTDPRNRICYEHVVSGSRKPDKQLENVGGIIADEMGLGKSLTMISAIATTMDKANRFQKDNLDYRVIQGTMMRSRATLIICPAALLIDNWLEEVSRHVAPGVLTCSKYHGSFKATQRELLESDMVFTTYATLLADASRDSVIHGIDWYRVVLDEAHSIRQQQTKQFRAVVALSAKYRWCLTGTPIQNTLQDLGALIRFLRIPELHQSSDFSRHIVGPIEKGSAHGLQRLRDLLQCICIRRTKELLDVSEPESIVDCIQLTEEERDRYCRIGEAHRMEMDQAISSGNLSEASSGLFRAILRLRIFCNTGLCIDPESYESNPDQNLSLLEPGSQIVCSYCSCDITSPGDSASANTGVALSCSHFLCLECFERGENYFLGQICCSTCGQVGPIPDFKPGRSPMVEPALELKGYSSKMEALVRNVMQYPTEKCIIFSSWKKSIQLAATYLNAYNIAICVVDGSMSLPERRATILKFQQDETVHALLMTLGTGAVGLNLTVANRVHILEPQWNPSIEQQAIGRVIRIGQEKKVTIVRYIVEHSVEQHIQTRQEKKLYLAQLGWNSSETNTEEDKFKKVIDMQSLLTMEV